MWNGTEIRLVGNAHPTEYQGFWQFKNAYFSAIPQRTPVLGNPMDYFLGWLGLGSSGSGAIARQTDQPTYRILIVDDQPDNRMVLNQLLSSVGFQTAIASNGQEAIQKWQQWSPHLIWMDINMPEMNGLETTQKIRLLEQEKPDQNINLEITSDKENITVIIAISASALDAKSERSLQAGCNDFVSKPLQESVIFDKMTKHLNIQYIYQSSEDPSPEQQTTPSTETIVSVLKTMPLAW